MTLEGIAEAKALPAVTSAEKGEVTALVRSLELSHEERECIYQLEVCFPNFACTWFPLEGKRTMNLQ